MNPNESPSTDQSCVIQAVSQSEPASNGELESDPPNSGSCLAHFAGASEAPKSEIVREGLLIKVGGTVRYGPNKQVRVIKFIDDFETIIGVDVVSGKKWKVSMVQLLNYASESPVICADNVESKEVRWLWPGRIPYGGTDQEESAGINQEGSAGCHDGSRFGI
jgi:hypothetical protein